ncbi:MAG: transcription elongation factor GreA [Ignavibacteria bacterium]|jgi:transcription elongation factor GreA|nr:MAG: transcription elongation factor GreA [Chlorobiota bacterium]KXK04604.1 MAG: transcription elongation factor GreA [Chlorobi bacterium OLB4]MBV6399532.1 Transcription elongation factor GreA [Ignavibacteria bacterium]MCC6886624.1 transcription elongation factor GreA [Ignavibacteriales bacterium]MCE7953237.1 transcription elongation factor GreA [Chlorobi bacterium CHB7]OQY76516.1 MAG: transcription elongation factor GreA [Ignavibacteriales bacterium UTCHB1]RIK50102.1 MAG: transcription el
MEQTSGNVYVTRERLAELENELKILKTTERKEIAERIAEARSHGDLTENAEYSAAKEAQSHLEMKIGKLENILSRVMILNKDDIPSDEVYVLSTVKLHDISFNEEITYTLVSPEEADFEQNKISIKSPLGQALLGKKVGEFIELDISSNKSKYKILEIIKP